MNPAIKTEILKGYKDPMWVDDYFIETFDKRYALYFYNIDEVRMGAYFANFSLFEENEFDRPLLNSDKVWIWYSNDKTFTYSQKSACLIFKTGIRKSGEIEYPYLLINPKIKQFSWIDWDFTSIYYSLEELGENMVSVKEKYPKELDRLNCMRRTGEVIDLTQLFWYDFTRFDDALEIYRSR